MAISYSISGGADAAKFNIDSASGALTFKAAPDFEVPGDANRDNVYEVQVKATDAGGAATTQDMRVTVTDVSENAPPQITSSPTVSVKENQTTVMTVTATDPDGGGSGGGGGTAEDGSAGAPAGTPQYATLLNGYAKRPPWKVAGVDYHVGIDRTKFPTNASLKDPTVASNLPSGCSLSGTTVRVTGSGAVLDGFDFAGRGRCEVSGSNCTVSNCNFRVATDAVVMIINTAVNAIIKNCEIIGPGTNGPEANMYMNGSCTMMYNLLNHCLGQNMVFSSQTGHGGETVVLKYNVIANGGEGYSKGYHGDWVQLYNAPAVDTALFTCNYNLWLQDIMIATGRSQGISAFCSNSGPDSGGIRKETFENNTLIGKQGAYINYGIIIDTTRLIETATIKDNYFDLSGIGSSNGGGGAAWYVGDYSGGNGGQHNGTVTKSGNFNMITGAAIS